MYKFADKNVDISSDVSYSSLKSLMSGGVTDIDGKKVEIEPEAFKDLDIFEAGDLDFLSDKDFALIYEDKEGNTFRRFPICSFDDAIVSSLYFLKNADQLPCGAQVIAARNLSNALGNAPDKFQLKTCRRSVERIESALCGYAEMLGFSYTRNRGNLYRERDENKLTFNQQVRRGIESEKTARAKLKNSDFVFVSEKGRLFPIYDKESLMKQASYFEENHRAFPLIHRHTFAKKLRDKAASLGVKLPAKTISKYASNSWSPTARECVEYRIKVLSQVKPMINEKTGSLELHTLNDRDQDRALVGFIKMADLVGRMPIDKYAETLYKLDKVAGFDKAYNHTIRNPFESTYASQNYVGPVVKTAANKVAFGKISFGGYTVDANKLMNLDIGDLGGMIDEDTFEELKNDPVNVFNSLPLPYKSVIMDAVKNF